LNDNKIKLISIDDYSKQQYNIINNTIDDKYSDNDENDLDDIDNDEKNDN